MLTTQKISFKNNIRYFSNKDLAQLLYQRYLDIYFRKLEKFEEIKKYNLEYNARDIRILCNRIVIAKLIQKFIYDHPYVKNVNVYKLNDFLRNTLTSTKNFSRHYIDINETTDEKIEILWELHKYGIEIYSYDNIPFGLIDLMNLILRGEYYLKKLLEYDFKNKIGYMVFFSNEEKKEYEIGHRGWTLYTTRFKEIFEKKSKKKYTNVKKKSKLLKKSFNYILEPIKYHNEIIDTSSSYRFINSTTSTTTNNSINTWDIYE